MKNKTPITELIAYMNQNRYFIGNDLYAEFERFLALEKQFAIRCYIIGSFDDNASEASAEAFLDRNYTQERN